MMRALLSRLAQTSGWRDRRANVALLFALSLVPLVTFVALAVDYSFWIQARSQLDLAADAAAMHAVRAASQAFTIGGSTAADEEAAGILAGQQWFAAQLGTFTSGSITASNIQVNVKYDPSPGTFTSTVAYTATVPTNVGRFITPSWMVSNANNAASAVITNSYVEIILLLDNSSSMLIGSTLSDIIAIEQATMCAATNDPAAMDLNYSWTYTGGYKYGATPPPVSPVSGSCTSTYDGSPSACFYVPSVPPALSMINPKTGLCTNTASLGQVPRAPCAFACHSSSSGSDLYGAARAIVPNVTLRLDVVQQAAGNVIQTLQGEPQFTNQFSIGVYTFNNALTNVWPGSGQGEASTNLADGLLAVNALTSPVTNNSPNTNFASSAATLATSLSASGNGKSPTKPLKYLFIVTDGLADYTNTSGNRVMGPMTSPVNETTCQAFKNLGIGVYVLYTPYLPIPNPFYLQNDISLVEPQANSPVTQALQACASSPANYSLASNAAAINTQLQTMLLTALNSAGRVAQ